MLDFKSILYDNSLKKGRECLDDSSEKKNYPGLGALVDKLRKVYPEMRFSGRQFEINGKLYLIRYNSNGRWESGGISVEGEYYVFVIINDGNTFSMCMVDSDRIKSIWDKRENKRGTTLDRTGSWSLNQSENVVPVVEKKDIDTINRKILEMIMQ